MYQWSTYFVDTYKRRSMVFVSQVETAISQMSINIFLEKIEFFPFKDVGHL